MCGGDCPEDVNENGICDDEEDCLGTVDACGVCDGPGAIYECGCEDIAEGDYDGDGTSSTSAVCVVALAPSTSAAVSN